MELSIHAVLERFASQLEKKVEDILQPLYVISDKYDNFGSRVEPYVAQREAVKAIVAGFKAGQKSIFLVGEPGTGKTFMGTWIAHLMGTLSAVSLKRKRTLVMCPPHLLPQWRDEIIRAYPKARVATIPDENQQKLGKSNMATLQAIHKHRAVDFVVISREAIKTDFSTREQTTIRVRKQGSYEYCCPNCGKALDFDTLEAMRKKKTFCPLCKSALFMYVRSPHARPSLAKYIQRKMKGFFSFCIFDEVHELSAADSAQGAVLGKVGNRCFKLAMTGTLMGGYASNLFYLLFRMAPGQMIKEGFNYNSRTNFVEKYGCMESVHEIDDKDNVRSIGKRRQKVVQREKPGISPLVVGIFLLDKSVFIRLSDFAEKLPLFREHPIACALHPSLKEGYEELAKYADHLRSCQHPPKVVSTALQALLAYPDTHTEEHVLDADKETGTAFSILEAPAVDIPLGGTEKEHQLLQIVTEAKKQRRKVLVYTTQTQKRDLQPRLEKLLQSNGFRSMIMTRSVSTMKRTAWINKREPLLDDLILHPRLIATGTNLIPFTVIVNFDCGYSTYTLRQSSRRSYRITQPADFIDVYYLYTAGTAQQDCLSLMARKNEVSLMVEGEINPDIGLSAMADAGGSVLGDLAKVINGKLKTENPLEVFSRLNKLNNIGKVRGTTPPVLDLPEVAEDVFVVQQPDMYIPPEIIIDKRGQLALFA